MHPSCFFFPKRITITMKGFKKISTVFPKNFFKSRSIFIMFLVYSLLVFLKQLTNNWSGQCPLQHGLLIIEFAFRTTVIFGYFVVLFMDLIYSDWKYDLTELFTVNFRLSNSLYKLLSSGIFSKSFNTIFSLWIWCVWSNLKEQRIIFLRHFLYNSKFPFLCSSRT